MGKTEDDEGLPSTASNAQGTTRGWPAWKIRVHNFVDFRCAFVLLLAVAVTLSAVFWLPFFHPDEYQKALDLDYAGRDIVASFMLRQPASTLEDRILQLEGDIFDEMSFSTVKVEIISLESASVRPNVTKVVFAVEADETAQSLIRASFTFLITRQSFLRLGSSLFGMPFSFEVLKFRGGITAIPDQKAFLVQNVQILFNFTLNSSIDEILDNFDVLRSELKSGLILSPYENLYIRLTNRRGSSVAPPTTVQSQVLLAVGINPSKTRLKQLAQTITDSYGKNLGLNNSVFGRVKQVQLSSILQHSLGGGGNSSSLSPSPLPSPSPSTLPPAQHRGTRLAPNHPPSPLPAPGRDSPGAPPPCPFEHSYQFPRNHDKHFHAAPVYAPASRPPKVSPVPAASHRSKDRIQVRPPVAMRRASPAPSPSSATTFSNVRGWSLPTFLLIVLLL
ncbi:uncharacterized protein LOC127265418 isoform X2 [Andrographis paniculata]|uniref:uncharacterized protein LOC127265418 isoform X2 n=1 Tax=Andrographis paniculata TaxID=175694 RepID=UPI0021E7E37A|nr:uncharacterized protein LOC127265418 isoform X2 [Andrographis paniculata]